jgi:uncharacterized protein YdhG (YjbR/CyaY superfamily)
MAQHRSQDVDAYIDGAPPAAQPMLRDIRRIVLSSAPSVTEKLSYGMPSYQYGARRLVHFSAAKTHVGVYGLVHVDGEVPEALAEYLDHRSTLRFRLDRPLPAEALAAAVREKAKALREGR